MTTRIEELYLEAEADIRNSNFQEAFQKYETILYDDPTYAPAHNSMGWIYKSQFENHDKAEMHFRTAIKSDPLYPHPYFHLAAVMMEMDRFKELEEHLEHCLEVYTIDKSWVHDRFGMMYEMQGLFDKAITSYQQAILTTMSNDKIKEYQGDIERCKTKAEIARNKKPWFSFKRK
jgi:tetratricopeptide (TPR) repeat protein